jgi:hypothetical protein
LLNLVRYNPFSEGNTRFVMRILIGKNYSLKASALIILICLSFSLLNNCSEEKDHPRSYPRVKTNPVTNITANGATFSADIFSMGTEPIIEHGFVWDEGYYPDLTDDKILLGQAPEAGIFSADISSSLAKDVKYTVKAFVKTAEHVVYGLPVTFVSLGAGAPVVTDFEPKMARWQDTLVVTGKNFSWVKTNNTVRLNQVECYLVKATDTTLTVIVDTGVKELKSAVSVEVDGNVSRLENDSLQLLAPYFIFNPSKGFGGSRITLSGIFNPDPSRNTILFNNFQAKIVYTSRISLVVQVPAALDAETSYIKYNAVPFSVTSPAPFTLAPPKISSIEPLTGNFSSEVKISGENFIPQEGNPTVLFGNYSAVVKSVKENELVVYVPNTMDSIPANITVTIGPVSTVSDQLFTLSPPQILSTQPTQFSAGSSITINGTGFSPDASLNKVYLGTYPLTVTASTGNVLTATVPASIPGGYYNLYVVTGGYRRLLPLNFAFNSQWTEIPVPPDFIWIPQSEEFWAGTSWSLNNYGYLLDESTGTFSSFNPLGNVFTTLSQNSFFSYAYKDGVVNRDTIYMMYNQRLYRYDFPLNTWVDINDLPLDQYGHGVAYSINDKIYYGLTWYGSLSKKLYEYDPDNKTWTARNLSMNYSSAMVVTYFTIGNKGYALFADNTFCCYDQGINTWIRLQSFPITPVTGCVSFVINGKAYVGLGGVRLLDPVYADFWMYDPANNTWTKSASMPLGQRFNSVSFVANNKAYIGFGYHYYTKLNDFYEFDPNYVAK